MVTGSKDATARIWSLDDPGASPIVLSGHTAAVDAVAFTPDGRHVVTASEDGTLRVWSAKGGEAERILLSDHGRIRETSISPDRRTAVTIGLDDTVWLRSLVDGREVPLLRAAAKSGPRTTFSADGSRVAVWSESDPPRIFLTSGHTKVLTPERTGGRPNPVGHPVLLEGASPGASFVAFDRDGTHVLAGERGARARAWSLDGRPAPDHPASMSPDSHPARSAASGKMSSKSCSQSVPRRHAKK